MTEDIFCAAMLYTGAQEDAAPVLKELCRGAEARLRAMLLDGVEVKDIYESFVTAAAMLAAADLTALQAGDATRFTAGPVSVTRDDRSRARSLREQAMVMIGPWCQDAFCFLGVKA